MIANCGKMRFRYPDKPTETTPEFVRSLDPTKWIAQAKYDGWRAINFIDGPEDTRILSSSGNDFYQTRSTERKKVIEIMRLELQILGLPPGTILDSELVGTRSVGSIRGKHDYAIYIFDCLAWDGTWLTRTPFEQRWARCVEISQSLANSKRLFLATTFYNAFMEHFNKLKKSWQETKGNDLYEGLVLKRRDGTLRLDNNSCKKSGCMFKLKYRDIRDARF